MNALSVSLSLCVCVSCQMVLASGSIISMSVANVACENNHDNGIGRGLECGKVWPLAKNVRQQGRLQVQVTDVFPEILQAYGPWHY